MKRRPESIMNEEENSNEEIDKKVDAKLKAIEDERKRYKEKMQR